MTATLLWAALFVLVGLVLVAGIVKVILGMVRGPGAPERRSERAGRPR
jgi:hypothetical protein